MMLTFTGKDVLVAEQRRKDMIELAEQARQIREELSYQKGLSLSSRWLFAFGEQLVSWGCRLQARYLRALPQRGVSSRCETPVVRSAIPKHI